MKESLDTLYQRARRVFASRYAAGEASAMAFALLEDLYGASRTAVLMGKSCELSEAAATDFARVLSEVGSGVPLQYATGRALFAGRYFGVTPATLIPRPETEWLCSAEAVGGERAEESLRVLDCGTGSGCISITLALEHPAWRVEAIDISADALAVASDNALRLGARNVSFALRDMLEPLDGEWDVIVSNPPYICEREAAEMERHVTDYEPHGALFVPDADPLLFYRALAQQAVRCLAPGGVVMVECNRAYATATAALFAAQGLSAVRVVDDCFGAPRFVTALKL